MKFADLFLTLLVSFISLSTSNAWSQEQLPVAKEHETQDSIIISVSDKTSFVIEKSPNVENMKEALGLKIPDHIREHILKKGGVLPPEVNPLAGYEELSSEKKEHFQKIRVMFLKNVARALNTTKFVLGTGSIVGDSLSFVSSSVMNMLKKNSASKTFTSREKINFSERSRRSVQAVLQALDYKLWNQAPLLLNSNEFGISASLGIIIENGRAKSGHGGPEELGLSFAYNKTEKAFVFEIFHNSEKFSHTPAFVGVVGLVVKMAPLFGQTDVDNPTKTKTGTTFYPPVVPAFTSSGPDFFSAGLSTSLGLPPPPFVDMLTYTNKYSRNTIIRITVSPVSKGFIRLYMGDIPGSAKLITSRIMGIFQWISQQATQISPVGRSCEAVFQ
ncbi:MAG: hypothetical protein ACXWRA_10590 [Pseudobdellovibrionaceae bacterium]